MILYVVATPIGNLKDITLRALGILREVDLILAEDTRVARKLLSAYQINGKMVLSYHQHSPEKVYFQIKQFLEEGRRIALICDAGTPGISDPGGKLIRFLRKELPELRIVPIPGPSALTAALSAAGVFADRFLFLGFPPSKKKRLKFFKRAIEEEYTVVIYESPHRLLKTLKEIKELMIKTGKWREVVVFKEITKKFEESFFGSITDIVDLFEKRREIKGEYVIILGARIKESD